MLNLGFQVDFFLEAHRPMVSLLNDCEYANRKMRKIARTEFKKLIMDKLLFLKRYRISKQELPHLSNSRIVLEAVDTDGDNGHLKVALKFLESKAEYDLEKTVRDEIISYHKNAAIPGSISNLEEMSPEDAELLSGLQSVPQNGQTVDGSDDRSAQADASNLHGHLQKKARTGLWKGHKTTRHFQLDGLILNYQEVDEKTGITNSKKKMKSVALQQGCHCEAGKVTAKGDYSFRFSILDSESNVLIELAARTLEDRSRWIDGINMICKVRMWCCLSVFFTLMWANLR